MRSTWTKIDTDGKTERQMFLYLGAESENAHLNQLCWLPSTQVITWKGTVVCYKYEHNGILHLHFYVCMHYKEYSTYPGTVWPCGCWGSIAHTKHRACLVLVWDKLVCPDQQFAHETSGGRCVQCRQWPGNGSNKPEHKHTYTHTKTHNGNICSILFISTINSGEKSKHYNIKPL